ncbi:TonB-dependent receptor [Fluviicola sp.]|uniref:TonB-dependent receptor n=1 Tax=Fluviicola sp. TaxID=1917219 RepID=UPI003D27E7CC
MKTRLLTGLLIALFNLNTVAQTTLQGTIVDESGQSIPNSRITLLASGKTYFSDSLGHFSIETTEEYPVSIKFHSPGFQSSNVDVSENSGLPLRISLKEESLSEVIVSARRREETAQDLPIPISVVSGSAVAESGSFNVNRVKELVPSVQLYSSNPRNTTLNIRGLGSTFGLTNDGIDPGVGFYVDGVYYARPAATTLDFIDVEQIEVLRGPQGTLFGKNTTAGSFNITSKKAEFTPGANFELSYGNYGYIQAKASITGPISKKIAARASFSGTQRNGTIYNVSTGKYTNDMNNQGVRLQFLYKPTSKINVTLAGDYSRQRPDGYAQVIAGVVQTKRAAYRQFNQIISDLNYSLPSENAFDRKIDHNTAWKSNQDLGGISLTADFKLGKGKITSTTAWRFWNWNPSNDRDFTGLDVLAISQAPSKHQQWSQEVRYAGDWGKRLSGVVGLYVIGQELKGSQKEESGKDQWRFAKSSTSSLWQTPGLFEGYGINTTSKLNTWSASVFGQLDWKLAKKLHLLTGLRFNYDAKEVYFDRKTYGGLETTDPALIALKKQVYTDQNFHAKTENSNLSGQLTLSYKPIRQITAYGTFSTSYKPVGLNLGGLPTESGRVMTELAIIRPEFVQHVEIGIKTAPTKNFTLNITAFDSEIKDYQTQVQTAEVGVNRGYLANAEKVRVFGLELDGNLRLNEFVSLYANAAYTEGRYIKFENAPVPLEETGGANAFKDVSGSRLPGISKWIGSIGIDLSLKGNLLKWDGRYFLAIDSYSRSSFSSSSSESAYLNVSGYSLLNGGIGFRAKEGVSVFIWARNILNKNYYEQLLVAAGNAGQYAGVLGDPATYGVTIKYGF